MYAFGLILWELATWELPFQQLSQYQIMLTVGEKGGRPEIPAPSSPALHGGAFPGYDEYVALMHACWAQDAAARPGFDHIIAVLRGLSAGLLAGEPQVREAEAEAAGHQNTAEKADHDDGGGAHARMTLPPSPFE